MNYSQEELIQLTNKAESQFKNADYSLKEELLSMLNFSIEKDLVVTTVTIYYLFYLECIAKGDFNKAKVYVEKGLLLAKKHKNQDLIGKSLNRLAHIYSRTGEIEKSIQTLQKAIIIFDNNKSYIQKSIALSNLGKVYVFIYEDYKRAKKYLDQAYEISKQHQSKFDISLLLILGEVNKCLKNKKEAKKFIHLSFDLAEKTGNISEMIQAQYALASLNEQEKKWREAIIAVDKAIEMGKKNNVTLFLESHLIAKGLYLFKLAKYNNAIKVLKEALAISKNPKQKQSALSLLHQVYDKKKNHRLALKNFKLETKLKLELESLETKKHIETSETKFQLKLKEKEKEILRLQKVEMEQKAIRAQLNPHFFFNALNSIQKFIVDNDQDNAMSYLQSFSGLMRKTLENSEEMFITLEDEIAFLKDYLSLEQIRFNSSFTFEFIVDEDIEEDFMKIPTMLLQPYVENCIKHGVNGIENGKITMSFKLGENDAICCVIEDNGRGRNLVKNKTHKSMGTKLLEERMLALQDQYNLEFKIQTLDLIDENKNPTGTKVLVSIPVIEGKL